jgi:hypothetical protein
VETNPWKRALRLLVCGGLAAVSASILPAQLAPLEAVHRVNVTTAGWQQEPDVARADDGSYVVVWSTNGQPPLDEAILARRYSALGAPLGSEFRVDTGSTGLLPHPKVEMTASGAFLIVWENDPFGWAEVLGRAYDPDGAALGPPFPIHAASAGEQHGPEVVRDAGSGYLVAWQDTGPSAFAVRARRVSAAGSRIGPAFALLGDAEGRMEALDAAGPGRFLLAFTRNWEPDGGLFVRSFDLDGTLDPELQIASVTTEWGLGRVSVGAAPEGGFVIAWANFVFHDEELYVRQYSAQGDVVVARDFGGTVGAAAVCRAPDGTWLELWIDAGVLLGRVHAPDGSPVGPEFEFEEPAGLGLIAGTSFDGASNPVFVSEVFEDGEAAIDVYARRYLAAGVFLDGFESGDTARWSMLQP